MSMAGIVDHLASKNRALGESDYISKMLKLAYMQRKYAKLAEAMVDLPFRPI